MTTDPALRERNDKLLRAYLNAELIAARDFLEDRLAHLFSGFLGRLVNPIAKALYHAIGEAEVRKRMNEQFDVIRDAALDAETLGLEAATVKWTPRSLMTEEVVHRGNRAHPRFPEVEAILARGFGERLAAIAPLLAYDGPAESYEDVVRAVYPEPSAPQRAIAGQIAMAREVTAIVKANPKMMHFPVALSSHLWPVVDAITAWYEARAKSELARVYGARASPP